MSAPPGLRFGRTVSPGEGSVQWLLDRNGSFAPRQRVAVYLMLCLLTPTIAAGLWPGGAPLVLPFAGLDLIVLGAALFFYSLHAADRESLLLRPGRLTVECRLGRRTEQAEFASAWVRVEPEHGDRSLIELSGQGRSIAVGRFVRPELRRALADELRMALRRGGVAAVAHANLA